MVAMWKDSLWRQFGSAIGMLEKAIRACPDDLWSASMWQDRTMGAEFSAFWYVAFHTLFWLDCYLSGSIDGFTPPDPFTLEEMDPAGVLRPRTYSRAELLGYLEYGRKKCRETIENLTDERAGRLGRVGWGEVNFFELLLDNMRHVQEHGAQLNMFLGQRMGETSRWQSTTKS
jgi:hypothetical protein